MLMKKLIPVLFMLICCVSALPAATVQKAEAVAKAYQQELEAPCYKLSCYNQAVLDKNFAKIKNTFFRAGENELERFLRQGVVVQDRVITAPEYFIAEGAIGSDFAELFSFWAWAYKGNKELWADNLLEKLSLDNHQPYQKQMALVIMKELDVETVSMRTYMYAAAQAINAQGVEYFKLISSFKIREKNVEDRETASYPMPYALQGDNVCAVLTNRMQTAPAGSSKYLRQAKEMAGCIVANPMFK